MPVVDLLAPTPGERILDLGCGDAPLALPGDVIGWLETFGESFTSALPLQERGAYLREVRDDLEPQLRDANGTWVADYVRLRFDATKATTEH